MLALMMFVPGDDNGDAYARPVSLFHSRRLWAEEETVLLL